MTTTTMLAYHNDPSIKAKYLARVRAHREADELIQGTGWDAGRGCAVGCTLESYDHSRYPIELGIPEEIAHLEDAIFEGLPRDEAMRWPEAFLDAVPVGADLSLVWPRFALALLADPEHGVICHADDAGRAAIDTVCGLYLRVLAGPSGPPSAEEWASAASAASARAVWAAAAAARAAAMAAAAAAAVWAAEAAAMAAVRAARAEAVAYRWQAETLLRLLREAEERDA